MMMGIHGGPEGRTPGAGDMPAPIRDSRPYEVQRFEHLVLGRHRPRAAPAKISRKAKPKEPVLLAVGIEEIVELRERWSHKQGTPETHEHQANARDGAIRRLYLSGAIDAEQKAAADHIAETVERITRGVSVRTASLETRVDMTRAGDGTFYEALAAVRLEVAYGRWRERAPGPIAALLEIIVGDVSLTIVAKRHRIGNRRMKKLLLDALDLWPRMMIEACKEIDPATLLAAQAAIL
jgi:hypothetical protein